MSPTPWPVKTSLKKMAAYHGDLYSMFLAPSPEFLDPLPRPPLTTYFFKIHLNFALLFLEDRTGLLTICGW